MTTEPFWGLVGLLGVIVLAVIVVEVWERWRHKQPDAAFNNTYLQARQREQQQAADRVLEALYPTSKKGPTGFLAQNERRPTTKEHEKNLAREGTTDGQPRIRTASKGRVN